MRVSIPNKMKANEETVRSQIPELWTAEEVANRLKINIKTLYSYVNQRRIPYRKIYGLVRFVPDEVCAWLDSIRVEVRKF